MREAGLFGLSEQLKRLSDCGDPLETMSRVVDFKMFRPALEKALAYGDGAKGGRPPYDPVAMFKVLILAAQNTVSDAPMEFLIRNRLSWLRFLGIDLGAVTPDENTIRLFRDKRTRAIRLRLARGQPTKPEPAELTNADRALLRAAEFDGLAWALPRISGAVAMRLERAHLIGHHYGQWYLRPRGFKARVDSGRIVA